MHPTLVQPARPSRRMVLAPATIRSRALRMLRGSRSTCSRTIRDTPGRRPPTASRMRGSPSITTLAMRRGARRVPVPNRVPVRFQHEPETEHQRGPEQPASERGEHHAQPRHARLRYGVEWRGILARQGHPDQWQSGAVRGQDTRHSRDGAERHRVWREVRGVRRSDGRTQRDLHHHHHLPTDRCSWSPDSPTPNLHRCRSQHAHDTQGHGEVATCLPECLLVPSPACPQAGGGHSWAVPQAQHRSHGGLSGPALHGVDAGRVACYRCGDGERC